MAVNEGNMIQNKILNVTFKLNDMLKVNQKNSWNKFGHPFSA